MKKNFSFALLLVFFLVHKVRTGAIKAPLSIITLDDISEDERKHLDAVHVQYERSKRSGSSSSDLLGALKTLLAQGAKAKLRLIGRASAAASSSLASSSSSSTSGKSYPSHGYSYNPHPVDENTSEEETISETFKDTEIDRIDRRGYKEKPDPFGMKKAVLNTLLQAVKAIKGGVLALKGQLIKGGGYLLVGGGKLVKAKGEVITNLGKKIARTAFRDMHSSEVHEDGSYGHYHPSEVEYEHSSGPGPSFPDHFHHVDYQGSFPDKNSGVQSGILILKRVPSGKKPQASHHAAESTINEYRAEEPTFGTVVGKLFSAASSFDPDSPAPFTDYRQTHPQPDEYAGDAQETSDDSDHHDQGNFDSDFELEPAFDSPEATKVIAPESSGEIALGSHNLKITEDAHEEAPKQSESPLAEQKLPETSASNFNGVPQGTNLGAFANLVQDFQQLNPNTNFQNHDLNVHFVDLPKQENFQYNVSPNLVSGKFAEPPANFPDQNAANDFQNFQQEPSKPNSPNIFDHNFAEPPGNLLQFNLQPSQADFQRVELSGQFGSLARLPSQLDKNDFTSNANFLGPYNPEYLKAQSQRNQRRPPTQNKKTYDKYRGNLKTPPRINQNLVDPSANLDLPRFSRQNNSPKGNHNHTNFPPYPRKQPGSPNRPPFPQNHPVTNRKIPSSTRPRQVSDQFINQSPFIRSNNQPRPPNFDIVQSVTYQLGPNGPTKI